MKQYIEKEFRFEASHFLQKEGCDFGKCGPHYSKTIGGWLAPHGHSYILKVRLYGEVCDDGTIMNFVDLKKIVMKLIVDKMDHSLLNDSFNDFIDDHLPILKKPFNINDDEKNILSTCENMSKAFAHVLAHNEEIALENVSAVGVTLFETVTSSCYYECEVQ